MNLSMITHAPAHCECQVMSVSFNQAASFSPSTSLQCTSLARGYWSRWSSFHMRGRVTYRSRQLQPGGQMWPKRVVTAFTQPISFENSSPGWSKGGGRLLSRVALTSVRSLINVCYIYFLYIYILMGCWKSEMETIKEATRWCPVSTSSGTIIIHSPKPKWKKARRSGLEWTPSSQFWCTPLFSV